MKVGDIISKSESQIKHLSEVLIDLDMYADNPIPLDKQKELYHATLEMINNPEIYGKVRDIVLEIHKQITVNNIFNIKLSTDINFGEYAYKLCDYISLND